MEEKKKKHCFARCKSKSNKENSSLMSSDVGFQFVIPFYLQLLGSTVELPDLICKNTKDEDKLISEDCISDIRSDELHLSEVLL